MAVKFTITIPKLDEFLAKMTKFPQVAVAHLNTAIKKSLLELNREAILQTPVKTGHLRRGYRLIAGNLQGLLSNPVNYGIFVHEGTPAHLILPRVKKALWWKGALHPVRVVHHPGTIANPFLQRAVENSEASVLDIFKTEMDAALNETAVK